MKSQRANSIQELLEAIPPQNRRIIDTIRPLFLSVEGVEESVKWDCFNYVFPNGMRCYINCRKKKVPVLGVSRGARMVKQRPELLGLFDEVKKVVGKVHIHSIDTIETKGIAALIEYIATLPSGIGVI